MNVSVDSSASGTRISTPSFCSVTLSLCRRPWSGSGPLSRNWPMAAAEPKSIGVFAPVVDASSAGPPSSFFGSMIV